jgi:hypothetical protein
MNRIAPTPIPLMEAPMREKYDWVVTTVLLSAMAHASFELKCIIKHTSEVITDYLLLL